MSETRTPYGKGDSVISTRCLLANPTLDTRVEIPTASRGTIVEIDTMVRWAPYCVVFETDNGALVEVRVSAEQIGRVESHQPLVPVLFEEPHAYVVYPVSYQYPNRWCKRLHEIVVLLSFTAYLLVAEMEPFFVLTASVLLLLAVYTHQLVVYREFTWLPEVFKGPSQEENEDLPICPTRARQAAVADLLVVLSLGSLVAHYLAYRLAGDWPVVKLFAAHIVVVGLLALLKVITHHRTVH